MTKRTYIVEQGWIETINYGGRPMEEFSDDPFFEHYDSLAEARAAYDAIDLAETYRGEKMTAGKLWNERDAYKKLEVVEFPDDEGSCPESDPEIIEFERFGIGDACRASFTNDEWAELGHDLAMYYNAWGDAEFGGTGNARAVFAEQFDRISYIIDMDADVLFERARTYVGIDEFWVAHKMDHVDWESIVEGFREDERELAE